MFLSVNFFKFFPDINRTYMEFWIRIPDGQPKGTLGS